MTALVLAVFDTDISLYGSIIHRFIDLESITSLVSCGEGKLRIAIMSCQKQQNSNDCGIFAVAFTVTLAFGLKASV